MSDAPAAPAPDPNGRWLSEQLARVIRLARSDLSVGSYIRPFINAEWVKTPGGAARAELADGRFVEITPEQAEFGNVRWKGTRRMPLR